MLVWQRCRYKKLRKCHAAASKSQTQALECVPLSLRVPFVQGYGIGGGRAPRAPVPGSRTVLLGAGRCHGGGGETEEQRPPTIVFALLSVGKAWTIPIANYSNLYEDLLNGPSAFTISVSVIRRQRAPLMLCFCCIQVFLTADIAFLPFLAYVIVQSMYELALLLTAH